MSGIADSLPPWKLRIEMPPARQDSHFHHPMKRTCRRTFGGTSDPAHRQNPDRTHGSLAAAVGHAGGLRRRVHDADSRQKPARALARRPPAARAPPRRRGSGPGRPLQEGSGGKGRKREQTAHERSRTGLAARGKRGEGRSAAAAVHWRRRTRGPAALTDALQHARKVLEAEHWLRNDGALVDEAAVAVDDCGWGGAAASERW